MNSFRTELPLIPAPFFLEPPTPILAMGSCFAEHIGKKLSELKFPMALNPFGILYHPLAIASNLQRLIEQKPYLEEELFFHQDCWHSFDHHGHFSHPDPKLALTGINEALYSSKAMLTSQSTLILTLGTAFVFEHRESKKIVANCHKLPGGDFQRYRLEQAQIVQALSQSLELVAQAYPQIRCILTVSPVRHLRDGLIENQKSKAVLLLAVEDLAKKYDWVHYFPAYELVQDDLRDYRFYAADLIHPSQPAIDYIWSYFSKTYFNEGTQALMDRLEKILTACRHRPFHPHSKGHQAFLQQQLKKIAELEEEFSFLNLEIEREGLERQLG